MTHEHDIAEAAHEAASQGAPDGAPESAPETAPAGGDPAGEPVAPVGSVEWEAAAPQSRGPEASEGSAHSAGPEHSAGKAHSAGQAQSGGPEAGAAGDESTDHERQLEHDLEELAAKAEKADEYLDLAQRTRADFENYRKRAAREAAAAQERGIAKLAKELLPAVDNLDRALEAAQSAAASDDGQVAAQGNGTSTLISGIKLVHDDVIAALARAGIERFSPEGEKFDPQQHEAIAQHPVEGKESGTVIEVYQRGYRLGEVVIRPARVVVAA
ncbi:MAG: nucleotide exchange factor GrpE [Solirubrobacterales bacterium]|nr:nucleotide exchange factor GrpE [Solirubrobacterales bacterium]